MTNCTQGNYNILPHQTTISENICVTGNVTDTGFQENSLNITSNITTTSGIINFTAPYNPLALGYGYNSSVFTAKNSTSGPIAIDLSNAISLQLATYWSFDIDEGKYILFPPNYQSQHTSAQMCWKNLQPVTLSVQTDIDGSQNTCYSNDITISVDTNVYLQSQNITSLFGAIEFGGNGFDLSLTSAIIRAGGADENNVAIDLSGYNSINFYEQNVLDAKGALVLLPPKNSITGKPHVNGTLCYYDSYEATSTISEPLCYDQDVVISMGKQNFTISHGITSVEGSINFNSPSVAGSASIGIITLSNTTLSTASSIDFSSLSGINVDGTVKIVCGTSCTIIFPSNINDANKLGIDISPNAQICYGGDYIIHGSSLNNFARCTEQNIASNTKISAIQNSNLTTIVGNMTFNNIIAFSIGNSSIASGNDLIFNFSREGHFNVQNSNITAYRGVSFNFSQADSNVSNSTISSYFFKFNGTHNSLNITNSTIYRNSVFDKAGADIVFGTNHSILAFDNTTFFDASCAGYQDKCDTLDFSHAKSIEFLNFNNVSWCNVSMPTGFVISGTPHYYSMGRNCDISYATAQ